jgi:pimeloyl-ACP methyl ester carboxylesterase
MGSNAEAPGPSRPGPSRTAVATTGGLSVTVDTWPGPSERAVVLLHGGGQTRHAWKGTGATLATAGHRVHAVDLRGHGDSSWDPAGDYSLDALIGDLSSVLDRLGETGPVVVGASIGGCVALAAVGEGTVKASGLVLVDIAVEVDQSGIDEIITFMEAHPNGFTSLEEVADAIAAYQPHRARDRDLSTIQRTVRLGTDGRYRWHWDPAFLTSHGDHESRQARLDSAARRVTVPTLVVRGVLSRVLAADGAEGFRDLCPHATVVHVDGAAHMVAGDHNDAFAAELVRFLSHQ